MSKIQTLGGIIEVSDIFVWVQQHFPRQITEASCDSTHGDDRERCQSKFSKDEFNSDPWSTSS